jgi:hypothetical protein
MKKNESMRIYNEATLQSFICVVHGLHDALLHEGVLLHPGYVGPDGRMWGDADLPNARLIFQSQFADVAAVQLELKRVSRFRYEPRREFRLEGEFKGSELILFLSGKQDSALSEIRASEAEYRLLGKDSLGSEYQLIRT